ncbi:MAG: STAS domain-containing protein [Terrimicrobiaceae bacterium]
MQIEKLESGNTTTLRLSGEIDLHASPTLRGELQACVQSKSPSLFLDFSGVDYIDSSGLATLIEYVRESSAFGGKLALFGLQKKVRTIFDLVRLNELFVISGTAEEAAVALAAK